MRFRLKSVCCLAIAASCAITACAPSDPRHVSTLSPEARLQLAEAADASGDSDLAITMYSAAAASAPSNVALQLRCADALARSGKIGQARQLLMDRLHQNRGQPDLIRALALVDLVAGQPAEAIAQFDRILARNPRDVRALGDKAVALDLLGQHATAQATYREVLALTPNDPAATNNLAVSMMLEGHIHQALETLEPMQDAGTSPPRLKVNLGILYALNGNAEQSRQLLGDFVTDGDLSALTRALSSSGTGARPGP
jgi:Flp pilus assembly protein TadD